MTQDLNYTHYTVESGLQLPSNEVYGILFDRNEILWATTDRGIWRYDGTEARQFTVADGLKENSNFRIFKTAGGSVYVSSINNYLYKIVGDSVRKHPMSEVIHETGKSGGFIQQITEKTDGSLLLSYNRPGLFRFKSGEVPSQIDEHRKNHGVASLAIYYQPDEFFWDMIGYPDKNQHRKTRIDYQKGWIYLNLGIQDPHNNFRKDLSPIGKNEFLFSYSNKVFHLKNGKLMAEKTFPNEIIAVYADKKSNFWIGLENEGALRFLNNNLKSKPLRYLKEESVSGISQDHEGNYWFSTTTNGIFQCNTLDITVFKNFTDDSRDNIVTALATDGENVYLGTQAGSIFKGTDHLNQDFIFHRVNMPFTNGPIRKLCFTPDSHLIVFNNHVMEIDTAGGLTGIKEIPNYAYDCVRKATGEWVVSLTSAIYTIQDNRIVRKWNEESINKLFPGKNLAPSVFRVRSMFLDSVGRFWLGSQNAGLFTSQDSVIYSWIRKDSLFGKRTHDITSVGRNIWVSIADYGLAVIRPDSSFIRITQKGGLSSDIIDVLFAENDSIVWAGTNNGLNRITMNPGSPKPDRIDYYTMKEGLPSNRIFQIIKHKKNIWVATTQGVIRLNPEFTKAPEVPVKLVPGPLWVNGKPRKLTSSLTLNPDDRNLVFHFNAITYRKPSMLLFRYKLDGIDKEYITTSSQESRYPDLTSGVYTFCLNASYTGIFDPANEKTFIIRIQKYWYETTLARSLYGVLLMILLIASFSLIFRSVKKRELEKRQLLQAEKRSLLSQMNPHFIFNSLNSIQHFIIQNDHFQANNYLTDFSGLIRKILDNSKKNLIPLNEEISTLMLYLGIEKLRFEEDFEYTITKDSRIDYNNMMIPPMLIQPFVENAIWHGLMPLKTKGFLNISFAKDGDYILCQIEDNGIGREQSVLLRRKKELHTSTGIKNVEERIDLINKMNNKKIHLSISDLRRSDGSASGTRIELLLPIDL